MNKVPAHLVRHIDSMRWRGKLQPICVLSKTYPAAMTSTSCRKLITNFFEQGEQWHTALGATLWALLDFLQSTNTPYILEAHPTEGYMVRLKT